MKMLIFGNMDNNGKFRGIIGSDAIMYVDGRYNEDHIIEECKTRLSKLFNIYHTDNILDIATCFKYGNEKMGFNGVYDYGRLIKL